MGRWLAALLGHTRERTNLRSQTMSGILRAAAPLARRLNAVPKGPIAQQTRGMACECPRTSRCFLPPAFASGLGLSSRPLTLTFPAPLNLSSRSRP